jgi:hypothetical protein
MAILCSQRKTDYSFFLFKNGVVSNNAIVKGLFQKIVSKDNGLLKFKNIFLLKEHIFTSPQLKITLFKTVLIQLTLMLYVYMTLSNIRVNLLKRE